MLLAFVLIFVVLAVAYSVVVYNQIVRMDNQINNAWSQIDVQLKRRHDLIPNLVETVKGYVKHERETLEKVIEARSAAVSANTPAAQAEAETNLNSALGRLLVVVEDYPDLKADESFLELNDELVATEDKISYARNNYNNSTLDFNNRIEVFPSNILANMFGFNIREYFELQNEAEREPVKVEF
ncbi:MAG: LemA family protein [Halanaerobiales bacterium]